MSSARGAGGGGCAATAGAAAVGLAVTATEPFSAGGGAGVSGAGAAAIGVAVGCCARSTLSWLSIALRTGDETPALFKAAMLSAERL